MTSTQTTTRTVARRRRIGPILLAAAAAAAIIAIVAALIATADGPRQQTADVFGFAAPEDPVGASSLARHDDRVDAEIESSGLAPDEAITLWWVVFNDPEACSPPACGEDDMFVGGDPAAGLDEDAIAAADVVVAYAAGDVTDGAGRVALSATLAEGGPVDEIVFGSAPTLKDTAGAEVHLVLRSHGPAVADRLDAQLSSFAGGCDVELLPPATPTAVGECADVQFAVHQP